VRGRETYLLALTIGALTHRKGTDGTIVSFTAKYNAIKALLVDLSLERNKHTCKTRWTPFLSLHRETFVCCKRSRQGTTATRIEYHWPNNLWMDMLEGWEYVKCERRD
jgi:hypothetical protein